MGTGLRGGQQEGRWVVRERYGEKVACLESTQYSPRIPRKGLCTCSEVASSLLFKAELLN